MLQKFITDWLDLKDGLNKNLIQVFNIILAVFLLLHIINVFAIFKFKQHKKYQYMRYFNHCAWIILTFLTVITFIIGAALGCIGILAKDAIPVINFVLGQDNLNGGQLIIEDKLIAETMNICLYHGGDLASEFFGLQNTEVDYLNQIYIKKNITQMMSSINKDELKSSSAVNEFSTTLEKISKDILLIKEDSGNINSPKYLLNKLNKWTDSTYDSNYIKDCINVSKDRWVVKKDDCSSGYTYASPSDIKNFSQNCLVISDWSEDSVKSRYQSTPSGCPNTGQQFKILEDGIYFNWAALDNISKQNQIIVSNMITRLSEIQTKFSLVANITILNNQKIINYVQDLYKTLDEYLDPGEDFYDLIDCSHLKYDLYVMYSNLKDKLSSNSLLLGTIFIIVSLANLIGNGFLVFFIIKNKQKVKKYELLEAEDQEAAAKNNPQQQAQIQNVNPNMIEMQKLANVR
jgi:hypothetical protein